MELCKLVIHVNMYIAWFLALVRYQASTRHDGGDGVSFVSTYPVSEEV